MIKAHIDSDGMKCLDIAGSAPTIVAEFGVIINQYYSAISKSAPQLLPHLRIAFEALVAPDSPIWTVDDGVQGIFINRRVDK